MKLSYKIITFCLIGFSLIHLSAAPLIFDRFTIRVGWFLGVGLMGVFLGFLNISHWRTKGKDFLIRKLCIAANLTALIYGSLVITVDHDPQGFAVMVIFIYLFISSLLFAKPSRRHKTNT